jgi:hypothetical protein
VTEKAISAVIGMGGSLVIEGGCGVVIWVERCVALEGMRKHRGSSSRKGLVTDPDGEEEACLVMT